MSPRRISEIADYLIKQYIDSPSHTLPPPILIKGTYGTGKSWIINIIKQRLEENKKDISPYVIQVPLQLSASNLVKAITEEISASISYQYRNLDNISPLHTKRRIVLLIDNIDRLLNIPSKEKFFITPERTMGVGAAKFQQIRDVSEFRSFLIENSSSITVIASSENTAFMEDVDQPFFQFFNILELKPFNKEEIQEFILTKLKMKYPNILALLDMTNENWPVILTEGRITYAKFIVDAISELNDEAMDNNLGGEKLLRRFILLFLGKISPYIDLTIQNLSYTEKKFIDYAALLPDGFYANQIRNLDINISQTLKSLKKKNIIISDKEGHNAKYNFSSSTFKVYLRYYKNGIERDILSPHKPLLIRK